QTTSQILHLLFSIVMSRFAQTAADIRQIAGCRLQHTVRPLNGTCEHFFSGRLYPTVDFQKSENAEHRDHRSQNGDHSAVAESKPGHSEEVSHRRA
ncbi:MAG: hypothetical protein WBL81_08585, partial [Pseudolabrys sp.]